MLPRLSACTKNGCAMHPQRVCMKDHFRSLRPADRERLRNHGRAPPAEESQCTSSDASSTAPLIHGFWPRRTKPRGTWCGSGKHPHPTAQAESSCAFCTFFSESCQLIADRRPATPRTSRRAPRTPSNMALREQRLGSVGGPPPLRGSRKGGIRIRWWGRPMCGRTWHHIARSWTKRGVVGHGSGPPNLAAHRAGNDPLVSESESCEANSGQTLDDPAFGLRACAFDKVRRSDAGVCCVPISPNSARSTCELIKGLNARRSQHNEMWSHSWPRVPGTLSINGCGPRQGAPLLR